MQYTCKLLVCSIHGHVGVTHSTTAKAEEEAARWRSITAVNKMAFFQSPQGCVPRQINIASRGQQLMYNAM